MTTTEGQTTTPSGSDVLLNLRKLSEMAERVPVRNQGDIEILNRGDDAISTVAALIARNAELEAQASSATESLAGSTSMLREVKVGLQTIAAENKALREAGQKMAETLDAGEGEIDALIALKLTLARTSAATKENGNIAFKQDHAKVAELLAAAEKHAGTPDNPNIGWLSPLSSNKTLFRCESCKQEGEDCTKIPHTDDCTVTRLFAAIRAMRGES